MTNFVSLETVRRKVIGCHLCPRLVHFRETVPARAAFKDQEYWRRPVPGFGDPKAWLMLLALAPAAHGGNRTGRPFTGDESARFLFKALYREGFANQPTSESIDDGLELLGCYMTASVKCVPPGNKPLPQEIKNCSRYCQAEIRLLPTLRAVLALGKLAFDSFLIYAKTKGHTVSRLKFKHGACYQLPGLPALYVSFHPSPRNTYTGKLSEDMLCEILHKIRLDNGMS